MGADQSQLTQLLCDESLDPVEKLRALFPLVYSELRALAEARLRGERIGHTLSATALVHETYAKIATGAQISWQNRAHFFYAAGRAMREILVDYARNRRALKRSGKASSCDIDSGATLAAADSDLHASDYLALDEALSRLEKHDARSAQIVILKFFAGLTGEETAQALELSERTVRAEWAFARAWLKRELGDDE